MQQPANPLTAILERAAAGDSSANEDLFERIYPTLRKLARSQLNANRRGTICTTELVNEASLKLLGAEHLDGLENRRHQSRNVRYAFDTTGRVRYEREIEVMPKEFGNHRKGQDIDIVYDPADPDNNMLSSMVTQAREALDRRRTPIAGE